MLSHLQYFLYFLVIVILQYIALLTNPTCMYIANRIFLVAIQMLAQLISLSTALILPNYCLNNTLSAILNV